MNVIGPLRELDRVKGDWYDAWFEPLDELEPVDLHLAQRARRLGEPMPPAPELPRPLPRGLLGEDSIDGSARGTEGLSNPPQ